MQIVYCRYYKEILKESKEETQNVLNVRIEKIRNKEQIPGLTQEDIENILFHELKIIIDAVVAGDISSRYNFKDIIFREDHDVVKYLGHFPQIGIEGQCVT